MYKQELKIAKQAAKQAGKFLRQEFFAWKKKNLEYKMHSERVTWCDKKAENIILKLLKKHFPEYGLLSEECGKKNKPSEYRWIIDPLDGTTNFTIHHSMFAVAIALVYKDEIVLGIIYNPILDEIYYASKNNGAYKNNKKIKVSSTTDFKKSIITYCHGSGQTNTNKAYKAYKNFHNKSHHCRHFGCTSLEMALVASGRTEAHLVPGPKIWDIASGVILIKEAGGTVTTWKNKPWNIKSKSILASNTKIHLKLAKDLKKLKLA